MTKFKINSLASGEDIYLHKITVSGEKSAESYLHIYRRYITKEIIYFIIHSKYFLYSDWLKHAHNSP